VLTIDFSKKGIILFMKRYLLIILFIIIDIATLYGILYFTLYLNDNSENIEFQDFIFISFTIISLFYYEKIYTLRYDFWQETYKTLKALFLAYFIVFASLSLLTTSLVYSKYFITLYFLLTMVIIPVIRRITKLVIYRFDFFKKRVYVVGMGEQVNIITKEFEDNWYMGLEINKDVYDIVIIPSESKQIDAINEEIDKYLHKCGEVYVVPYVTTMNFAHSNIMEYSNIRYNTIQIENRLLVQKNIWIKNLFDFVLSLSIIPFIIIIHFIIVFLIKMDSRGSVFFKQHRLGKDDNDFLCYKYRTMYENSDELLQKYLAENPDETVYYEIYHKYKNDPRITNIGKFLRMTSLDELPQIINVLRGEMSFVGPRPYMIQESEKLGDDKHFILKVKPGITGLWQVSGRNNLTFSERNELEVWYIKNWSLWIDFIILMKTIKVVLLKVGAR